MINVFVHVCAQTYTCIRHICLHKTMYVSTYVNKIQHRKGLEEYTPHTVTVINAGWRNKGWCEREIINFPSFVMF